MVLLSDSDNEAKRLYQISGLSKKRVAALVGLSESRFAMYLIGKPPTPARQQRIRELLKEFQFSSQEETS